MIDRRHDADVSSLISVVTPAYNASDTIHRAIESVLSQNPNIPYIVVDDCSLSDHVYDLDAYKGVTYRRNEVNLGGASTRNVGLALVKTPYVLFLDADDYLLPGTIEELKHVLQSGSPDIIYFPWYRKQRDGSMNGPIHNGCINPFTMFDIWINGKYVPPCAVFWRADFLRMIGSWGEGLRYNDDTELSLRALLYQPKITLARSGGGVYIKGVNPNAVSNAHIATVLDAQIHIMQSLRKVIDQVIDDEPLKKKMKRLLGKFMFVAIRMGYAQRIDEKADIALTLSRSLGYKGYVGTLPYRLLARMMGVTFTERLFQYIKDKLGK